MRLALVGSPIDDHACTPQTCDGFMHGLSIIRTGVIQRLVVCTCMTQFCPCVEKGPLKLLPPWVMLVIRPKYSTAGTVDGVEM